MMALPLNGHAPALGSYDPADVQFLLRPIRMAVTEVVEKERRIQSGAAHYSEMLSPETAPSPAYMAIYQQALAANGPRLAGHINLLSRQLLAWQSGDPQRQLAIVSLARAGTPIGVLLKRALARLGTAAAHYSISIIRGRGIDQAALRHILARHHSDDVVFVDGWTGKGAIASELRGPLGPSALGVTPRLLVVADPAGVADLAATGDDYLIPSGILNGVVSGLISRSVLPAAAGADDFHGCVRLDHLAAHDVSRAFVDIVDQLAAALSSEPYSQPDPWPWSSAERHALAQRCTVMLGFVEKDTGVTDRNRIKPGIAEATRAVLRRVPDRLYLGNTADPQLAHLVLLARERQIRIEPLPPGSHYRAVAVIAQMAGE
ncbi:cysteine protease StiP domain-containing protein [Sandarakinorhabdus sp.]|uniref:cysteine protease StiP domain-containing protein n=1 Tax=Sandarakinorhabdus sp. TaxID=1916663 RepID=UPI00333E83BD